MRDYQVKRPDENTPEIVQAVQECGWQWVDTHSLGGGFPDGLAVHLTLTGWQIVPVEIKNPKSHAHGKNGDPFTDDEHKFYAKYPGLVSVVNNREDILALLKVPGRPQP